MGSISRCAKNYTMRKQEFVHSRHTTQWSVNSGVLKEGLSLKASNTIWEWVGFSIFEHIQLAIGWKRLLRA